METEQGSMDVGGQKMWKKRKWEKVKIGGNSMKNGQQCSKDRKGGKHKKPNGKVKRDSRQNIGLTSNHTLCGVRDVIQGDVCPHVSTHLCLEAHSERCRVGQYDICVCPLVTMVSSGCPHQQTGATGSNSVDLTRCKANMEILGNIKWHWDSR